MAQMQKMWPDVKIHQACKLLDELNIGLKEYKLDTRLRQAHFMAQARAESGRFSKLEKILLRIQKKIF
ncbi:hypothetical protein IDM33_14805 [Acinetobacter seifertii]|nr:hypothetical protein [Acinetobacter seifertii]